MYFLERLQKARRIISADLPNHGLLIDRRSRLTTIGLFILSARTDLLKGRFFTGGGPSKKTWLA